MQSHGFEIIDAQTASFNSLLVDELLTKAKTEAVWLSMVDLQMDNPRNPTNTSEEHQLIGQSLRALIQKETFSNIQQWEKDLHCPKELFQKMGPLLILS